MTRVTIASVVALAAAALGGCVPSTTASNNNSAAATSADGLTAAEACSSTKTRDGLVKILADHVPGDAQDQRNSLVQFRSLVTFDMTTVDAIDPQTGALTCSANLKLNAGDVAPYLPIPDGIEVRHNGRQLVVRASYRLRSLADEPGSMLTLTDDDAISRLAFNVQALRETGRRALDRSADLPEQYGDKVSPAYTPSDDAPDGDSNETE